MNRILGQGHLPTSSAALDGTQTRVNFSSG